MVLLVQFCFKCGSLSNEKISDTGTSLIFERLEKEQGMRPDRPGFKSCVMLGKLLDLSELEVYVLHKDSSSYFREL